MSPKIKGRIDGIRAVADDVRIVDIVPEQLNLCDFSPGQYVMLSAGGHDFRPYSIACAPNTGKIELHIRDQGGGLSHYIARNLAAGEDVLLQGPLGVRFHLPADKPLLLIAGGVGISPVKSIVEETLKSSKAQVHVLWGVRDLAHLYLDGYFTEISARHSGFTYSPVIGNGLADAIGALQGTLDNTVIYMAGPRVMIDAMLPALAAKKAKKDYIFSDAFTL